MGLFVARKFEREGERLTGPIRLRGLENGGRYAGSASHRFVTMCAMMILAMSRLTFWSLFQRRPVAAVGPSGAVLWLLAVVCLGGCRSPVNLSSPLRTVSQISALREKDIAAGQRVELRGVITLLDPEWRLMAIQDSSGGTLVDWPPLSTNLHLGDQVDVSGATSLDNHVPLIVAASVRAAGAGTLPRPQPASADSISCGANLYRFVEVEIKPEEAGLGDDSHTAYFALRGACGRLEVIGRQLRVYSPGTLAGRRLRVRGVPLAFYSPSGAIDHVRLMFDDETDVDLLETRAEEKSGPVGAPGGLSRIQSVKAVKDLPRAEAARGYPVQVEGVVTAINPRHEGYFFQEGSTAVCIFAPQSHGTLPHPGERVRLSGVTEEGGFAPVIRQGDVAVLGTAAIPRPIKVDPGDVFQGWEENIWAEVEGTGTAVVSEGGTHQLEIFAGPRRMLVWFSEVGSVEDLQALVNARILVRGVYTPLYTASGGLQGFRLFTSSPKSITVVDSPEAAPSFRTIASLSQFDSRGVPQRRFRTAGAVTYRDARGQIFLQDGESALRVVGNGEGDPLLGTWATVEGFLSPDVAAPQMERAQWIGGKPGVPVAPAFKLAESLVSGDLGGRLVAVEGFLVSRRTSAGELQLNLLAGRSRFDASLVAPGPVGLPGLRPGVLLRLTGVCVSQPWDTPDGPRHATVLLRKVQDVAVVRPAPWWDLQRAAFAAFGASLLLICALAVVVRLRHNLVLQTEMRSNLEERLAQAQKLESVGRLAGGVAHDFNNLLTVINGYSELSLERTRPDEPLRASLLQIRNAGVRAAELTQSLLAFSRKQLTQPRILDPNAVVTEAVKMFERVLGEDIELHTHLDPMAGRVMADPGQLHRVLMNLVVNARDAMPRGGRLTIETGSVRAGVDLTSQIPGMTEGAYVSIGVTDTGTGMSEEVRRHLFEPFFTTKGNRGTGLGLATVHGIVRQSGGWIGVASKLGKGTTFRIYLPQVGAEVAAQSVTSRGGARPRGSETVLVVEDQSAVRHFVCTVLEQSGYRVLQASDGPEAIVLAGKCPETIHLLVSDLVLPHMDGREVADKLKKTRPALKVLHISGYAEDAISSRGMPENDLNYLPKPFSPEQLVARVRETLAAKDRPTRILIADGEAGVRGWLRAVLEQAGYEVMEAADGEQTLNRARSGRVDLLIADLAMLEKEGIETIETLRTEGAGIGVIVMSGAFGGPYLELADRLGAQAVLTKPVDPDVLLARVAEALQRRV